MTQPTMPTIDLLLLTAALIEFVIMYAAAIDNRPELARRHGQVLPPTTNYMIGVGIIVLVFAPLVLVRGSYYQDWAVPAFQVLADLAAVIVAGGAAAFAHRKRHGEPIANPSMSPEEVKATLDQIRYRAKEIADAATQQGA